MNKSKLRRTRYTENIQARFEDLDTRSYAAFRNEIRNRKHLSREEEGVLAERIANGDLTAANELVDANMKFIFSVASRYSAWNDLPVLELVNEAAIAAYKSALKFDPKDGCRFISYAIFLITYDIQRYIIANKRTVSLPAHTYQSAMTIKKFAGKFESDNGRKPTDKEIAEGTGVSGASARACAVFFDNVVSLDKPIEGHAESKYDTTKRDILEATVPDLVSNPDTDNLEYMDKQRIVADLINSLDPTRKHAIIETFFNERTAKDIAEELGVSTQLITERRRQAIQQMAARARRCKYGYQTS